MSTSVDSDKKKTAKESTERIYTNRTNTIQFWLKLYNNEQTSRVDLHVFLRAISRVTCKVAN